MKINVINKSKHPLPEYATEYSAGLDLRANIDSPIELKPLDAAASSLALLYASFSDMNSSHFYAL